MRVKKPGNFSPVISINAPEFIEGFEYDPDNRVYKYTISFSANPRQAVLLDSFVVKMLLTTSQPDQITKANVVVSDDPKEIVEALLKKSIRTKKLVETYNSISVFPKTYWFDLTSYIPNNLLPQLRDPNNTTNLFTKTVVEGVPLSDLEKIADVALLPQQQQVQKIVSLLQQNLFTTKEAANNQVHSDVTNKQYYKTNAYSMIFDKSVDPASLGEKLYGFSTVFDGIRGTSTQKNNKLTAYKKSIKTSPKSTAVVTGILNSFTNNITDSSLSTTTIVPVKRQVQTNLVDVSYTFEVSEDIVQKNDFYLIFQVLNKENIIVQTDERIIKHSFYSNILLVPTEPPTVSCTNYSSPGRNIIKVKQNDVYCDKVKIYRKIIPTTVSFDPLETSYKFVGDMNITVDDGEKIFSDKVPNSTPVIYRVVPVSRQGQVSFEFGSVVAEPVKILTNKSVFTRNTTCSISSLITTQGIEITVGAFPTKLAGFKILRKKVSNYEKQFEDISGTISTSSGILESYKFLDKDVVNGECYEYSCVFIYTSGYQQRCTNVIFVEYIPFSINVVNTTITDPVVTTGEPITVKFNFKSQVINNPTDIIRSTVLNQQLSAYFGEDLTLIRDQLQQLIAHEIRRVNLTTGEQETFGVIQGSSFDDYSLGLLNSVKPVKFGNVYRYDVIPLLREPSTVLKNFVKTVPTSQFKRTIKTTQVITENGVPTRRIVEEEQTFNNYSFKPSKWYHPLTLNQGILVSEGSLKRNYSKNDFQFGNIGSVTSTTVTVGVTKPSVVNIQTGRIKKNTIALRWSINGNQASVDHFLIVLNYLSGRAILGKCSNISVDNKYLFLQEFDENIIGTVSFSVIPVYYDYTYGNDFISPEIVVNV